jgi:hypothetical protein
MRDITKSYSRIYFYGCGLYAVAFTTQGYCSNTEKWRNTSFRAIAGFFYRFISFFQ